MRERILTLTSLTIILALFGLAGKSDVALNAEMRELQAPAVTTTTVDRQAEADAAIAAAVRRQEAAKQETSTTTAPPTTTTLSVPNTALCGEWWVTAVAAGWDEDHLPTLDRIMWNESRCRAGLVSNTNDVGLVQLNVATWSHLWHDDGFSTEEVRDNPVLNLLYAKEVSNAAADIGWCIWQPWHGFSGNYC